MVYVDNMRAPHRGYILCHMIADSTEELLAMADLIGVKREYLQEVGTYREHFDIALSKKKLALKNGAKLITTRELGDILRDKKRRTSMKLYVVKSGVYSDKKWHGVFSTPEKAEELVKELILRRGGTGDPSQSTPDEWGKPHYEEWELDVPEKLEEGHYEVVINKDGSVRDWEFENWGPNDAPPKLYGDCYLGFGSTLELARRSAEELRRVDLTQRGLTGESSER